MWLDGPDILPTFSALSGDLNSPEADGSLRTELKAERDRAQNPGPDPSRTMKPSSVLFVFLQLCCFQMMLVSRPVCKLPGWVVQNTHNHLRDLVGPTALTASSPSLCFYSSTTSCPAGGRVSCPVSTLQQQDRLP